MSKRRFAAGAACLCVVVLGGCGGGGSGNTTPNSLSGSVAVGVPMTDARLRILDAIGNVVAENVVVAADGTYLAVVLTGTAPYRLEACGYTGDKYDCLYSIAYGAGTANVTPLTSAVVLLANGARPDRSWTVA